MRILSLSAAVTIALTSQNPAVADSVTTRLNQLETQNRAQEATLQQQAAVIAEQQKTHMAESDHSDWYRHIEVFGLIEVEAGSFSPETGNSESDISLATVELGIKSKVNAWVEAGASLLYEQDQTDLEVDTGYITIANTDVTPLFLTAGQLYVPFGVFETNMISDPLTLEIGETRETTLQIGATQGDFSGSVYLFNGDTTIDGENQIDNWGANLGYAHTANDQAWTASVGYLNDLGETDTMQAFVGDRAERTGGWTASASATWGRFNLIGEYLAATDDFAAEHLSFKAQGACPTAWNLEAGFTFAIMGKKSIASVGYQGTSEALALELPEQRWLLGLAVEIFDKTSLKFEWARSTDYDTADGGSGDIDNRLLAQIAVEF
ncbi:LbtU family siderophore porin [Chromatium okenii]|jgi:hypothetical protein|uniref:LbtU family siderophore porin n=1 Tax=Chromatium okenii TaxID=61644 RepID=A0A2S7XT67_9GAMM|nr:LbtU family siderophore porin [Chromatium okenii]PQJ96678.1 hypothetical protein CXB77_07845 [Chromatium okenii]